MSVASDVNIHSVRILSLNGGGVRGLFTISVLAEIERILNQNSENQNIKIGDYFDLITGTSIGGILALGLASGKSAQELESVFFENAAKIFPPRLGILNFIIRLVAPLYSSKPLRAAIGTMIDENSTFDDLTRRVMIPAVNLSTGNPQFFKTPHNPAFQRDGKLKLIDAALATSAAPTYFAPHFCEDLNTYFADGGLVANNPSYIGLLEVFKDMSTDFNVSHKDIHILNIGTAGAEFALRPKVLGKKWWNGYINLWGGGEALVLATMAANQSLHTKMLERELDRNDAKGNYVCIDDTIPSEAAIDITLDNARANALNFLKARGKQLSQVEFTQNMKLKKFFTTPAKPFKRAIAQEKL